MYLSVFSALCLFVFPASLPQNLFYLFRTPFRSPLKTNPVRTTIFLYSAMHLNAVRALNQHTNPFNLTRARLHSRLP